MGSCEQPALTDEPSCGLQHLLPVGAAQELGICAIEGCRKSVRMPPSCADTVSRISHAHDKAVVQSLPEQQSCSDFFCMLSNSNASAKELSGGCLGLCQNYDHGSAACGLPNSNSDCVDALDGYPGSARDCDNDSVFSGNATETCSLDGSRPEDENGGINLLEVEKTSCHEVGHTGLCSNESAEELTSCNWETDWLCSERLESQGEHGLVNISEDCEICSKGLNLSGLIISCVEQNGKNVATSVRGTFVEVDTKFMDEKTDALDGIDVETCNQILPLPGGELPLELLDIGGLTSKEKDTDNVCDCSMEQDRVVMEEKVDVLAGVKVDLCSQTLATEENFCNLIEGSSIQIPLEVLDKGGLISNDALLKVEDNERVYCHSVAMEEKDDSFAGVKVVLCNQMFTIDQNSCNSKEGLSGEMPLKSLDIGGLMNNCAQEKEQDIESACGPYVDSVTGIVEGKDDVLTGVKVDLHTENCTIAQNACNSREGSWREISLASLDVDGFPSNCVQQKEEDSDSVCKSYADGVTKVVEGKDDVLNGAKVDSNTEILTVNPITCKSSEASPGIAPDYAVEKLDSVQLSQSVGVVEGKVDASAGVKVDLHTENLAFGKNACNSKERSSDEIFLESLDVGGLMSNCSQQREQDSMRVCHVNRVMEVEEGKDEFLTGEKVASNTERMDHITCNSKGESSGTAPDYVVEKSDTLQLCPFVNVVENGSFNCLAELDMSGIHVLGTFDSNGLAGCSGQVADEGKCNGIFDYASEAKCRDLIGSSPRRSARINNSSQKTQAKNAARKCRKATNDEPRQLGIVEIILKAVRRKRSSSCKRARSSHWGLLGNVTQVFEQFNVHGVNQVQKRRSRIPRVSRRNGKRNVSQADGRSKGSTRKHHTSSSRIRLKVKVGKEVGQNSLEVIVPEVVDTSALASASDRRSKLLGGTRAESVEFANIVEDDLGKGVSAIRQYECFSKNADEVRTCADASFLDVLLVDDGIESTGNINSSTGNAGDSYNEISSLLDVEALGGGISDRYVDPGTSPDSEVINLLPDAQGGAKVPEDLHDPALTSSTVLIAPGDVISSNSSDLCSKKGKKLGRFPRTGKHCVEDELSGQASKSKVSLVENCGLKGKIGNGFYCGETFYSSTATNVSSNTSSGDGFSRDVLLLSKMECSTEASLHSSLDVGIVSSESQNIKKKFSSSKSKGHKVSKSSKSNEKGKCSSEIPGSARSRRGNACRRKENQLKLGKKSKVKEKGISVEAACTLDNHLEKGNPMVVDLDKTNTGCKSVSESISNLDMVLSGVEKHCLPPRIAWVRCDDCHKWRCIPAALADTIEETNCRWTCKDNMDKAFADCSIPQGKSNAEINAELEISDASGEEDAYDARLNSKALEHRLRTVTQQSTWTLIKSNLFLHRNRKNQIIDEIMVCHCKPPVDGRKGCGDACLNRMLNIECIQGTCPCGDFCSNQQFQKRKYAKLQWFRCGKKGYGLQLLENISQGHFLIEYVGEVLDLHTYEARQRDYASRGHKHFYFMTLNGSEVIDASAKGNLGRFINHSCDPNCRTEKWMVNGEVCIGLFALRDINKGEELTFDYNYVRVFGAAAKKCLCGSSQCRGFIGGDPLNSEVIVQGDSDEEYPEPVMVCEGDEAGESVGNLVLTSSFSGTEMPTAEMLFKNKEKMEKSATAGDQLGFACVDNAMLTSSSIDTAELQTEKSLLRKRDKVGKPPPSSIQVDHTMENEGSMNRSESAVPQSLNSLGMEKGKLEPVVAQQVEPSPPTEEIKLMNDLQQNISVEECSLKKLFSDSAFINVTCKTDLLEEKRGFTKSNPLSKTFRSSSLVKKGKSARNVFNVTKPQMTSIKSQVLPNKPKKVFGGSANARFEGVEGKLNELLDADGGISRRKDSTRRYLKLLLLTAASGDSGNGEAIQSARDLSMILDALLKTKLRMVLLDIINKNGLQMLHNVMKRYRRDYIKTPILRKLLKVLEYLAKKAILTSEHINGGPPCPGMESFRDSILALTEHTDKQVHQIARSFRDKWIPRPFRKFGCMEKDDGRMEFFKGLNCNRNSSHNYWRDLGVRPMDAIDCVKQITISATPIVASNQESCSSVGAGGYLCDGKKSRKRKSRWDQPAQANFDPSFAQPKELKLQPSSRRKIELSPQFEIVESGLQSGCVHSDSVGDTVGGAKDGGQRIHDDVPPGFSSLHSSPKHPSEARLTAVNAAQRNVGHPKRAFEVFTGQPQQRFNSRLPISYGIPLYTVQQYGTPFAGVIESWVIAPGVPFHPFPPLPPFPHVKKDCLPSQAAAPMTLKLPREELQGETCGPAINHTDHCPPSTSGATPCDVDIPDVNNQHTFKRLRGSSSDLGRKYYRQQKLNNLKVGPPWIWKRSGWAFSKSGMCNIAVGNMPSDSRNLYPSDDANRRLEDNGNSFHQQQLPQNHHDL